MRCLRAPKNKSAGPDGVPPHLLRHLPNHIQQQLYQAIIAVWNGQNIPVAWLQSRVVLIYKKKDPRTHETTGRSTFPQPYIAYSHVSS